MITYGTPTAATHGEALNTMAQQAFVDTFAHLYREQDLNSFLRSAYGPNGLLKDLADPTFDWRVATTDGKIAGYVKVGPLGLPAPDPLTGALELKQMYVLKDWHGQGIAPQLMDWAIAKARERKAPELYLSVFDHNHRAKRFYARYGFVDVGPCAFRVGEQLDEDRMWKRSL
jgi:ribosomal protein S18 acetylase RimI-like enzyme